MKKNVYLVQASTLYGNNYYLPYAIGMLAAFAFADEQVNSSYSLKELLYKLDDIDECIARMENPAFVGFSNSIWNYEYNLDFAKKLKDKYPECIIEFGGHHVPPTSEYLDKYPFVDVLIFRKGEEAFRDVLLSFDGKKELSQIPNIAYRNAEGKAVLTEEKNITISDYPSPYLGGYFDDIIKNGEYPFSCVLETNRGCPYHCSYCDWGELNSKVRLFPLEKVFAELEWMSRNQIEFVYCVDANFGMFERDMLIAEKLVELKETTGCPNRLQVSYAKNEFDRTFEISRLLSQHGIGKGATMSLQSLNPEVLENIGRNNMTKERFAQQISRYRDAGIPTYTELILGLPGETKESFIDGLCNVLEMGQHNSVTVYNFELLPNSELSRPENMKKFGIKTMSVCLDQYHCEPDKSEKQAGYSNIVIGNNTMSSDDWVDVSCFATFLQAMHHFGLLQCISMYCRKEYDISYRSFYEKLYEYFKNSKGICRDAIDMSYDVLNNFASGRGGLICVDERFGGITYPVEEEFFLSLNYDREIFYDEAMAALKAVFEDVVIPEDLLRYQKAVVMLPGKSSFTEHFSVNYRDYFNEIMKNGYISPAKGDYTYDFYTPFNINDWESYSREIVWFGRRNGRVLFSSFPNEIKLI